MIVSRLFFFFFFLFFLFAVLVLLLLWSPNSCCYMPPLISKNQLHRRPTSVSLDNNSNNHTDSCPFLSNRNLTSKPKNWRTADRVTWLIRPPSLNDHKGLSVISQLPNERDRIFLRSIRLDRRINKKNQKKKKNDKKNQKKNKKEEAAIRRLRQLDCNQADSDLYSNLINQQVHFFQYRIGWGGGEWGDGIGRGWDKSPPEQSGAIRGL